MHYDALGQRRVSARATPEAAHAVRRAATRWSSSLLLRIQDLGFRFRIPDSRFRVQLSGFTVYSFGFKVKSLGFRVQGSGFRVQGSGFRA